ncbi:MAG: alanine racemase [Ignavibacteriales bacterium]|nr:alanine racemase [Ignavibacteriales bacterium]
MSPTYAEINLKNFVYNYLNLRKKAKDAMVMPVVKADAYGHGMVECVEALAKLTKDKPEYYGVALLEEAIELRNAKIINEPILCFAPICKEDIPKYLKLKIYPTVTCDEHIKILRSYSGKQKLKFHINIDTGMRRLGFDYRTAAEKIKIISRIPNVIIDGIYTHFATSDEFEKHYAKIQLLRFNSVIKKLEEAGINYGCVHASNSGAIIDLPEAKFDMVRPGISLYGYYPSLETTESVKLKPVMSIISKVSTTRKLLKGESISYGRKYYASNDTTIATVPIGYADGFVRALTNNSYAIIKNKIYEQVGSVTMDRIMINVNNDKVKIGDEVVLIGKRKNLEVNAWDWAVVLNTIPYEVTCNISKRVPRKYIK